MVHCVDKSFYEIMMRYLLLTIFIAIQVSLNAQNVYKTPSGKKYHLSTCRMVKNVSKQILTKNDLSTYNLDPCKICNPPIQTNLKSGNSRYNKAVGTSSSVRCKGQTKSGSRCKHMTKIANGYCYQHTSQSSSKPKPYSSYSNTSSTPTCGARTKSGGRCKRKVKGGGYCYQHK